VRTRRKTLFTIASVEMFGDVVICQFPFTSGAVSKVRPALVLFDLPQDVVLCRITSAQHSGPVDVGLTDWQAAGLLRASVARLDRIVTAERTVVLRGLGRLSSRDLEVVRRTWNQKMML
jgi:mRNA interferase MazF